MNHFLKSRQEINDCTQTIRKNGWVEHGLDCKNFDIAEIVPYLTDGDILDMGADGSFILHNAVKLGLKGRKVGVDLLPVAEHNRAETVEYYTSDLMYTPFEDGSFDFVSCLSVIEHEVDFGKFAQEVARLLQPGGKAFVSFDYWNPKVDTSEKRLYGLKWNILDRSEAEELIVDCAMNGLKMTSEMDWTTQDAVINPKYCAPFPDVAYTFGIMMFEKWK